MTDQPSITDVIAAHKERLTAIRDKARRLFDGGATGAQACTYLSEQVEGFLLELFI